MLIILSSKPLLEAAAAGFGFAPGAGGWLSVIFVSVVFPQFGTGGDETGGGERTAASEPEVAEKGRGGELAAAPAPSSLRWLTRSSR
jgi:hypothetical protein